MCVAQRLPYSPPQGRTALSLISTASSASLSQPSAALAAVAPKLARPSRPVAGRAAPAAGRCEAAAAPLRDAWLVAVRPSSISSSSSSSSSPQPLTLAAGRLGAAGPASLSDEALPAVTAAAAAAAAVPKTGDGSDEGVLPWLGGARAVAEGAAEPPLPTSYGRT